MSSKILKMFNRSLVSFVSIFSIIFTTTCLNARSAVSEERFSKNELANFSRPLIEKRINTNNFHVVIEKMSTQAVSETAGLDSAEVSELTISPQQRDFEMILKFKSGNRFTFSGKIEWLANIPVLLRPIGADDTINVSDVGYQAYPIDHLNATVVMDAQELIGKTAAHAIVKPGLPVEKSLLKNPIIIKRGELVDIFYRSQCLLVSAKAKATQDLACGDTGTFETQQDNSRQAMKRISAKVVGPSTAEIIYGFA